MSELYNQDDVIPHGEAIVERFGGIRPMATKLNVPVTTVQGWKKRDAIPAIRRDEILSAAAHYDINLKGLVSESANQNARIAEDPALSAPATTYTNVTPMTASPQPTPQPQPAISKPAPQTRAQRLDNIDGVDMRQIKRTARRTSFVTTVCLAALLAGAGFMLFGGDLKNANQQSQRVTALDSRVTAMESRAPVSNVGNSALSAGGLQQQITDLSNSLTARIASLEQQLTSGAGAVSPALSGMVGKMQGMASSGSANGEWQSAIADLRQVVDGLQGQTGHLNDALAEAKTQNDALGRTLSEVSGRDLGAAAMLLALEQLRSSLDRQAPFTEDLALLRQVAEGTDPELAKAVDKMAPYAQTGILSPQGLKRELQASANDIITAKMRGEDVSIKDKIMARLQGLFSIHKDGVAIAGTPEHELIERASAQLDANDVAGAMATLQTLNGPAAEAAQPWENKAAATLAAQTLDGQLVNSIVSKIKSGLSGLQGSAIPGVVNAGPINMAPATSQPDSQPVPQSTLTPGTQALPNMPAPAQAPAQAPQTDIPRQTPLSSQSGVTIQQ